MVRLSDDEKRIKFCSNKCRANKVDRGHCMIYITPRPLDCEYIYVGDNGRVYPLDMSDDI